MEHSAQVIKEVDQEYGEVFGRSYGGLTEAYRCQDAEAVLMTLGSVTGTVRTVVDQMRAEGHKVGVFKLRFMRPFPTEDVMALGQTVSKVGVLEKNISFGNEGTVFTNVNSALLALDTKVHSKNYVGGLGGRDITKEDIRGMFMDLLSHDCFEKKVEFIGMGCAINE
jgi:pyruvate ferredoxin oxidoreductase alpha subunit